MKKRIRKAHRPSSGQRLREEAEIQRIETVCQSIPRLRDELDVPFHNRRQRENARVRKEASGQGEKKDGAAAVAFRCKLFSDLPLSKRTLDGLAAGSFTQLTEVQRLAIPQALAGRDVLAAAPTGSGKTLAFIVPLLESLWRAKWSPMDGLGALVLSPTRELAEQIFQVLVKVARFHEFSAGYATGGTNVSNERKFVSRYNILVATPGRLLQHMDEDPDLDCTILRLLVLDEADRILDLGFQNTVDAILKNIPKRQGRQTMLFSATQTKSVRALSRLSLSDPEYVSVYSRSSVSGNDKEEENRAEDDEGNLNTNCLRIAGIPSTLTQSYVVLDIEDKLSVAWSFLRTHLRHKIILFFSSCKQVRFVFEAFRRMRPGFPLLHIHGKMKQGKRAEMYRQFVAHKKAALLATDVAARGLDFPAVDWVVQVDCPPDAESYVHRVGRTARFNAQGSSLLFVNRGPEELFLTRLRDKGIEPKKTSVNQKRIVSIEQKLSSISASFRDVQHLAKRAVVSYIRAIYLRRDREVFNARMLDHEALAFSYGLPTAPTVTFREAERSSKGGDHQGVSRAAKKNVYGYHFSENARTISTGEPQNFSGQSKKNLSVAHEGSDDEDDDLLVVRKVHGVEGSGATQNLDPQLRLIKRLRNRPKRIVWDNQGREHADEGYNSNLSDEDESGDDEPDGIESNVVRVAKRLKRAEEEIRTHENQRIRKARIRKQEVDELFSKNARGHGDNQIAVVGSPLNDSISDGSHTSELSDGDATAAFDVDKQAALALHILEGS